MEKVHEKEYEPKEEIEQKLEFSTFFRLHHWVRVVSIIILVTTGFYLADPFLQPEIAPEPTNFKYALIRSWHIIFGFVAISMAIAKIYYFFFVKSDRAEISSVKDVFNLRNWSKQIGYYFLVTKHPALTGAYNVIQFLVYTVFYVMMLGLILTGLILYVHVYHEGLGGMLYDTMRHFEVLFGGLANVRALHHLMMWGVIIFVVAHVYMAVFNAIYGKEGTIESIISGYKWHKKH